jgi:surface carbohydrate biosynthesis protein
MKNMINFYIPIEIKNRELYSKILIAKYAAKKGFNVILGRKNEINKIVTKMKPGIYYGLGAVKNFEPFYKKLSEQGHLIVVNDEEGLVTYSDEMYLDLKVSSETIKVIDLLFTWGKENSRVISSGRPESTSKLCTAGNPRFDLLKPKFSGVYENEIHEIKKKYRKFVLVCTSFASCNHYIHGTDYVQELVNKKVLTSDDSVKTYQRYQQMKNATLQSFLEAIPMLANSYPDTDIVIRPHPSESSEPYMKLVKTFRNVYIENKFSIHPWLLTAKALVHHYCTTSIEAYSAKTPGFALRPKKDPTIEKEIPYECSYDCKSPDELIGLIHDCLDVTLSDSALKRPEKDYSDYVHNIDNIIASELIVNEICKKLKKDPIETNIKYKDYYDKGEFYYFIRGMVEKILPWGKASRSYISHKFDHLTVAEVKKVLDVYATDNTKEFKCDKAGHNMVNICYARIK